MKRFAVLLFVAAVAASMSSGALALGDYPPPSATITLESTEPLPGEEFSVTFSMCFEGEDVHVIFEGQTISTVCTSDGTARVTLIAPSDPGTYGGSGNSGTSDREAEFAVTVSTDVLPATGAAGSLDLTPIAGLVLATGFGLYLTSRVRRHAVH